MNSNKQLILLNSLHEKILKYCADKVTEQEIAAFVELKQKITPKRVVKCDHKPLIDVGWKYSCPTCGCACGQNIYHPEVTSDELYCTQCGQRLDGCDD